LKIQNNLWTIQIDAAGVYPVTYTKYRPGMGTPVYDDATLFEFLILEHSKPDSAGLPS
jgi:hypothetical protein